MKSPGGQGMDLPSGEGVPTLGDVLGVPEDPALKVNITTTCTAIWPGVFRRNAMRFPHLIDLGMELEHRIWVGGTALSISPSGLCAGRVADIEGSIAV